MSVIKALLDLQEIDDRIRTLQQEIEHIPERKKQEMERLDSVKKVLDDAKEELHHAQKRVNEMDEEVKQRRERIHSLKQTQVNLKTNREFSLYNLEIAKIEGDIDTIENRQIIALDDVIPVRHEVEVAEGRYKEEQESVNSYLTDLNERLSKLEAELGEVEKEREEAAKLVKTQYYAYYERLRTQTQRWPVVVKLDEKEYICGGCHLKQPPSASQMVRRNDHLVTCQTCSRILYAESSVG